MDIQVSSNFERLLFDAVGRDGAVLAELMTEFRSTGAMPAHQGALDVVRNTLCAESRTDAETAATIGRVYREHGVLIDPHTAVGVGAAEAARQSAARCADVDEMVVLACAHPAKFGDTVEAATGVSPVLPDRVARQLEKAERFETMDNSLAALQAFIRRERRMSS
jgi:threonine synthase